ncbi:hypothetical protein BABINDRAFT_172464 [Babjeviella inositovora NRRL Y-12698]|uniref:AB hydrolase-1 domain-containing protein n=1 Tax=Babjeviella inositovora NRRL Y-12698 TaxID=984486 RepID=A0A1E3QLM9_9ASCO|nr:uncharacterized protein BABINDRAFT_172464 [Babjeviella inositovora NRRL Y-12698]ODQ77982.1 hypothetical protein BABINDRAFT_172464 [Babjeviella inositovora NRRL Y-12698]
MSHFIHKYTRGLIAMEHLTKSSTPHPNLLIFIGGLGDNITTVLYVAHLARALDPIGWSVAELQLSASGIGWGTGSVARDVLEITAAVKYFSNRKVVLMGHSTGCQDVLYYLTQQYLDDPNELSSRPYVAGGILQASVSDRECYVMLNGQEIWEDKLARARKLVEAGKGEEVLPREFPLSFFDSPISAQRWVDLMDVRGADDYFSSDLTPEDHQKTFGKVRSKLLVAYSGNDECVPAEVDKQLVVDGFRKATPAEWWSDFSGLVPGATHNAGRGSEPGAREALIEKVKTFLQMDVSEGAKL